MISTPYDTRTTLLYKTAVKSGVPVASYIVDNPYSATPSFINGIEWIDTNLRAKTPLKMIYDYLIAKGPGEWHADIVYWYATKYSGDVDKITEFIKEINGDTTTYGSEILREQFIENYRAGYQQHLSDDSEMLKKIINFENRLDDATESLKESPIFKKSDLQILRETRKYLPVHKRSKLRPSGGEILSIFDHVIPNKRIPYLMCVATDGKIYHKLLRREIQKMETEDGADSEESLVQSYDPNRTGVFIFYIHLGDDKIKVIYDLNKGSLITKTLTSHGDLIKRTLTDVFTPLNFDNSGVISTRTGLRLYPLTPTKFSLREYILLHKCISSAPEDEIYQFYMNEVTSPYPLKMDFTLRYNPLWKDRYSSGEPVISFTLEVKETAKNNNYISISLNTPTLSIAKTFINTLLPILIIYYCEEIVLDSPLYKFYQAITPEVTLIDAVSKMRGPKRKAATNLDQLMDKWPEVFTENYQLLVPAAEQVKAVRTKEEAEEWNFEPIEGRPDIQRTYLPFPPPHISPIPLFYFTTINARFPYPGVKKNTLENSKYPYIPAAFQSNQNLSRATDYQEYYLQRDNITSSKATGHIKTQRALDEGRDGKLPEKIKDLLKFYNQKSGNFYRLGVTNAGDPNAFLACVMHAASLRHNSASVVAERSRISKLPNIADVLRQELYDMKTDEIIANLGNSESFLDPQLYYRALEVAYNVNIFVFTAHIKKNEVMGVLEEPRSMYFHTRRTRKDRKTILIFKNHGVKSDNLNFPHCELIVEENHTLKNFTHSDQMTSHCYEILEKKSNILTWTYGDLDLYRNFYNAIDISGFIRRINGVLYSQNIDHCGKMRGFTVEMKNGDKVTIAIPPHQPLDVRHSTTIYPCSGSLAEELIGIKPFARTDQGLWFPHCGLNYGIHIVITNLENYRHVKSTRSVPLDPLFYKKFTHPKSDIHHVTKVNRTFFLTMSLIKWLYDLYRRGNLRSGIPPGTPREFQQLYMGSFADVDESNYYTFEEMSECLPNVRNVEDGIIYLSKVVPNMVYEGKIAFHSRNYERGIVYQLNKHRYVGVDTKIRNYYQTVDDFIHHKDVAIYFGKNWKKELSESITTSNVIHTSLNYNMKDQMSPILYSHEKSVYIIQNNRTGSLIKALSIIEDWYVTGTNRGNDAPTYKIAETRPYVIYDIGASGGLNPFKDMTNGSNELFYEVVNYGKPNTPARYGSLIRIS